MQSEALNIIEKVNNISIMLYTSMAQKILLIIGTKLLD